MKLCAGRVLIGFCTESENAEARLNVHALSRCSQARRCLPSLTGQGVRIRATPPQQIYLYFTFF